MRHTRTHPHGVDENPARLPAQLPDMNYGGKMLQGALLPSLPPHAASPRSQNMSVAMYTLAPPADSTTGGWQLCLNGGNQLPLPLRLKAAAAEPRLGSYTACARQLTMDLSRLTAAEEPVQVGLNNVCTVVGEAIGAEAVALLPVTSLDLDMCLHEHNFDKACLATLGKAPPCGRLVRALAHELRGAAEDRRALNIGGPASEKSRPEAAETSQVAIRENGSAMLKTTVAPLTSALVTPVADPQTGSTVALLVCANASAGRFHVHDELFGEAAAYACLLQSPACLTACPYVAYYS